MVDVAGEAVDENERTGFGSDVDVGGGAGGWNGLIDNVVVAIVYEEENWFTFEPMGGRPEVELLSCIIDVPQTYRFSCTISSSTLCFAVGLCLLLAFCIRKFPRTPSGSGTAEKFEVLFWPLRGVGFSGRTTSSGVRVTESGRARRSRCKKEEESISRSHDESSYSLQR